MESVNFSMLGDPSIAESLGKKGTSTDLTLYDSGIIRTWVADICRRDCTVPFICIHTM